MDYFNNKRHLYHLVDQSPWPLTSAMGAFCMLGGLVGYMNKVIYSLSLCSLGLVIILLTMYVW